MPEVRSASVRVRISLGLDEYERWERLAEVVGMPVDALLGAVASKSLPGYEARLAALFAPDSSPAAGSGTAPAVDSGGGAGVVLNEKSATYQAALPRKGAGGKKRHR